MRRAIGVAAVAALLALQGCSAAEDRNEDAAAVSVDDLTTDTTNGDGHADTASTDAAAVDTATVDAPAADADADIAVDSATNDTMADAAAAVPPRPAPAGPAANGGGEEPTGGGLATGSTGSPKPSVVGGAGGMAFPPSEQANPAGPNQPAGGRGPASVPTPASPPPQGSVDCPAVGELTTAADCTFFEQTARRAEEGVGAFNAPDPMYRGEEVMLQLAISPAGATGTTPAETVKGLPGTVTPIEPLVGRRMRAELTGVGFDIVAKSREVQIVSDRAPTVWNWSVTAKKAQRHTLTVTTGVVATGSDGQTRVLLPTTRNITVNVKVGWWVWFKEKLEPIPDAIKAITAILVALAALIGAVYGVRKALRGGTGAPGDPVG